MRSEVRSGQPPHIRMLHACMHAAHDALALPGSACSACACTTKSLACACALNLSAPALSLSSSLRHAASQPASQHCEPSITGACHPAHPRRRTGRVIMRAHASMWQGLRTCGGLRALRRLVHGCMHSGMQACMCTAAQRT